MYILYPTYVKRESDGAIIPLDAGNADYRDFLAWVALGNEPNYPEPPPVTETIMRAIAKAREMRAPIISILDGLQASSLTMNDLVMATTIETAKQGLRDITKIPLFDCTTYEQMETKILTRYNEIVNASPDLKAWFSTTQK